MTSEPPTPTEEQLADWLAGCDERLAAGDPASSIDTRAAPEGTAPRVLRDLECVELLRAVWPQTRRQAGAVGGEGQSLSGISPLSRSLPSRGEESCGGADGYEPTNADIPRRIGRFEIRRELGQGGYGVVFLAFDPQLGREVALKIPRAETLVSSQLRSRFQYEARIAAGLDHPHIVPVYDAGEIGAVCYIASAYCPGLTLAEWLQKQVHGVAFDVAAELVAALADAVQHAHNRGVLHRDLKPGNIILTPRDASRTPSSADGGRLDFIPRLTDFGLAKLVEAAKDGQTRTHAILGTPEYMSPEQAAGRSRQITTASDVYGLGVILYELLTGRPPFRAETSLATLRQVERDVPVPPSRLRERVPRDLETICLKCLEKEPPRRYLSAHALGEDLHRFLAGEPVAARPVGRSERLVRWCRRNRVETALIAAVALALLAGTCVSTYFALEAIGRQQAEINAAVAEVEARSARTASDLAHRHLYLTKMLVAQSAWENGEIADLADLLEAAHPDQTLGNDYRRFEWYYWQRASRVELLTLPTDGPAHCVRYSPSGEELAVAGENGKVSVVDAATGHRVHELSGHTGPVWGLSFTRDAERLATASDDRTVRIWEVGTGKPLSVLRGHTSDVTAVAFSPNAQHVASASEDRTVRVWALADGAEVVTYTRHRGPVWNVTFSHDGKRVISCGDDGVHIWNAENGEIITTLNGHKGPVYCADVNSDGTHIATASEDGSVRIWDLAGNERVRVLTGHTRGVRSVQFSPDGRRLVSGGRDGAVRFWDADTGRPLFVIGHKHMVDSAVFSPDGRRVASVARDRDVKVWDASRERQPTTFRGHNGTVEAAAFSPDGKQIASIDRDGVVLIHDADSQREVFKRTDHAGPETGLAFHPQRRLLAVARSDHTVRIYDIEADRKLHELRAHTGPVHSVAFTRDGRVLASAGKDGTIHLWEPQGGKLIKRFPKLEAEIRSLAFSPDGRELVAAGSDHLTTVWEVDAGRVRLTLRGHTEPVYAVAFSHDGSWIATGGHEETVRVWNASDGRLLWTQKGHTSVVNSVAFSPDGSRLATGSVDKRIKLWDLATGQEVLTLKGHTGGVESVAFSADGQRLVSASMDGTVKVWDARPTTFDSPQMQPHR